MSEDLETLPHSMDYSSHFGVEQLHRFNFQRWKQEEWRDAMVERLKNDGIEIRSLQLIQERRADFRSIVDFLKRRGIPLEPEGKVYPNQYILTALDQADPILLDIVPHFTTASLARVEPENRLIRLNEAALASPILAQEVIHQEMDHFRIRSMSLPHSTVPGYRHAITEFISMLCSFERIKNLPEPERAKLFEVLDRYWHVDKSGQETPALDKHYYGRLILTYLESGLTGGLLDRMIDYIRDARSLCPTTSDLLQAREQLQADERNRDLLGEITRRPLAPHHRRQLAEEWEKVRLAHYWGLSLTGEMDRLGLAPDHRDRLAQEVGEMQKESDQRPHLSRVLSTIPLSPEDHDSLAQVIESTERVPDRHDIFLSLGKYFENENKVAAAIEIYSLGLQDYPANTGLIHAITRTLYRHAQERGLEGMDGMLTPRMYSPLVGGLLEQGRPSEEDMDLLRRLARTDAVPLGDRGKIRRFFKSLECR